MVLTIIALNQKEEFLQFLDPDLCTLVETHENGGLRTLEFTYTFQEYGTDKDLFQIGNKIWVQGDNNLTDCLYVINTPVTTDIYQENTFTIELEEVLVELNYAPILAQTEITASNGFNITNNNNTPKFRLNWNALNYIFGDYFNIGVCQKCISTYADTIQIMGTENRMTLLRRIEEETGNIFVTRYEKDILNNTIHRYLDFLNPNNTDKDWEINLEYDWQIRTAGTWYDNNGDPTTEDLPETLTPYDSSGNPLTNEYTPEDDNPGDIEQVDYTPVTNLDPTKIDFRICDQDGNLLNASMEKCTTSDETALRWTATECGLTTGTDAVIRLMKTKTLIGVDVNSKSFAVAGIGDYAKSYVSSYTTIADEELMENSKTSINWLDDILFVIYDFDSNREVFRTVLNTSIGHTHEEVLDFGFNLENVVYEQDETEVYSSVSPIITFNDDNTEIQQNERRYIVNRWNNLTVNKGQVIPLIIEKVMVSAETETAAKQSMGSFDPNNPSVSTSTSNYWRRPMHPNDNTGSNDKSFEFLRATAYWKAPYTKYTGFQVVNPQNNHSYNEVMGKPDSRAEKGTIRDNKVGNVESTNEDPFIVYNDVVNYLKEHSIKKFNIEVDVANLRKGQFNQYQLHDKVYLKLPDTNELVTARVTKTTKEAHDIAKNSIELDNYSITQNKIVKQDTYLETKNQTWAYPSKGNVGIRLVNEDYNSEDPDSIHYPPNCLITFILTDVTDNNTKYKNTYTRLTGSDGKINLPLKLNPGNYEVQINFPGDEEYNETNTLIKLNVTGTKKTNTDQKSATKQKTTKKTSKKKKKKKTRTINNFKHNVTVSSKNAKNIILKDLNDEGGELSEVKSSLANKTIGYKEYPTINQKHTVQVKDVFEKSGVLTQTVKNYWKKCGQSPDGKQIVSISKPSGTDAGKYKYKLYKTVFKNYCPICKRTGTLAFDGGKKNKCITSDGAYSRGYKLDVPEHEITCNGCDSDFCGVTGIEKWSPSRGRLTTIKKPVASSQTEFNKLVKGQLLHSTSTKIITKKVVTQDKNKRRTMKGSPSAFVQQKALDIVGNSTGLTALKKICKFMDDKIDYSKYSEFHRTARMVIELGGGNCCDQTRCFLELCDAAGLTEYYTLCYVHVTGHVYAKVIQKSNGKYAYVDCASDDYACFGYVCQGYPHGSCTSSYPTLPF